MLLRKNNDQIIELLKSFLKYAPHNSNNYNYIYWIYQKIVDWMTYGVRNNPDALFFYGGVKGRGICEAYALFANVIFLVLTLNQNFKPVY